jgi:hypothetical protein
MRVAEQISGHELEFRMLSVDNAVAQQELEGLTVSPRTVQDLIRVARGEMTSEQALEGALASLDHVPLLK